MTTVQNIHSINIVKFTYEFKRLIDESKHVQRFTDAYLLFGPAKNSLSPFTNTHKTYWFSRTGRRIFLLIFRLVGTTNRSGKARRAQTARKVHAPSTARPLIGVDFCTRFFVLFFSPFRTIPGEKTRYTYLFKFASAELVLKISIGSFSGANRLALGVGRAPYICEFLSKGRFVQWEKIKQKGRKGRNGGESESYCYYFLYVARIFRPVSDGAHARQYLRILRVFFFFPPVYKKKNISL